MKQTILLCTALFLSMPTIGYPNDTLAIEVRLEWQSPNADLDLYIVNPDNEICSWFQPSTAWGCYYNLDARGDAAQPNAPYVEQAILNLASLQQHAGTYTLLAYYYDWQDNSSPRDIQAKVDLSRNGELINTFPIYLRKPTDKLVVWQGKIAPVSKTQCSLYAVHDAGLNDSQFLRIDPENHTIRPLGLMHVGYDIESLATHPTHQTLYAVSSDDSLIDSEYSHLFTVDAESGELSLIGDVGFSGVDSISFASDGTLWGWAKEQGLIQIDITIGNGTMNLSTPEPVEALSIAPNTHLFYAAYNQTLLVYDGNKVESTCSFPGETEALEMLPEGILLFTLHNETKPRIHALDVKTCQEIEDKEISTAGYGDIEGLAWVCR